MPGRSGRLVGTGFGFGLENGLLCPPRFAALIGTVGLEDRGVALLGDAVRGAEDVVLLDRLKERSEMNGFLRL